MNARADVNAKNRFGLEPLFYLVEGNHLAIVEYLVSKCADPSIASAWFGSPLQCACRIGNVELAKSLHAAGAEADLGVGGLYGSPLQAPCLSKAADNDVLEVMRYLMEDAKADVNQVCGLYGTAVHVGCRRSSPGALKLLVDKYGANPQVSDEVGRLPIHIAAVAHFDSFQYLVKLGCDMHSIDKTGRSLLHWAAQSGNVDIVSLILSQPDNAVDAADKDGWTALYWAARGRSFIASSDLGAQADIIELLLKKGASKSVRVQGDGDETWTPLEMAVFHDNGDREIQLLMQQHAAGVSIRSSKRYRLKSPQKRGYLHIGYCDCCESVSVWYLAMIEKGITVIAFKFTNTEKLTPF